MVLERLALAVAIIRRRRTGGVGRDPVMVVIDPSADEVERAEAIAALRLSGRHDVRMIAVPMDDIEAERDGVDSERGDSEPVDSDGAGTPGPVSGAEGAASAPSGAATGIVRVGALRLRAIVDVDHRRWSGRGPAGLGTRGGTEQLPDSWQTAVSALRLAGPLFPVVDADEIGILGSLGSIRDGRGPHHDQQRLADAIADLPWAGPTVEALVLTSSRRAAAAALGVHHATLQARVQRLGAALGYDLTTPIGAHRLLVSHLSLRLDTGAD